MLIVDGQRGQNLTAYLVVSPQLELLIKCFINEGMTNELYRKIDLKRVVSTFEGITKFDNSRQPVIRLPIPQQTSHGFAASMILIILK